MNVRRFRSPEMGEAILQVKRALGEDAVILRTRKVRRGGILSFLSKELIEVTAASPDTKVQGPAGKNGNPVRAAIEARASSAIIRDIKEDLGELRTNVRDIANQVKFERMPILPEHLSAIYRNLIISGVDERLAKELAQDVSHELSGDQLDEEVTVTTQMRARIIQRMPLRALPRTSKGRARVIALVGPTGVGKTTTLAKLVTSYRFWGRLDTALISADTYRVAAIEQLKTFASIARLPLEAVYQPAAMTNALSRHRERDAMFIDTAGRSQTDPARLDELAEFIAAADPDEVLLCLTVSTRMDDQLDVIERYSRLKPTGIIFTKLDETRGSGMMLNVLVSGGLPVTALTCGQNVPDDVLTANSERLADVILSPNRLTQLQRDRFSAWISAETLSSKTRVAVD